MCVSISVDYSLDCAKYVCHSSLHSSKCIHATAPGCLSVATQRPKLFAVTICVNCMSQLSRVQILVEQQSFAFYDQCPSFSPPQCETVYHLPCMTVASHWTCLDDQWKLIFVSSDRASSDAVVSSLWFYQYHDLVTYLFKTLLTTCIMTCYRQR